MTQLAPGASIGILGGGQLGRMTALAAARLGFRTHILCPEAESPAALVTPFVTIADYAGQTAQLGWIAWLGFLALVSVSLGVLNLLPIPLLDGGHLVYYFAEIVKGSPVSEKTMEIGQRLGLAVLLGLTFFAFYNDINRLFTG